MPDLEPDDEDDCPFVIVAIIYPGEKGPFAGPWGEGPVKLEVVILWPLLFRLFHNI